MAGTLSTERWRGEVQLMRALRAASALERYVAATCRHRRLGFDGEDIGAPVERDSWWAKFYRSQLEATNVLTPGRP